MIDIYKLIKGITVKQKVGSNDNSEMVSQFSSSSPTCIYRNLWTWQDKFIQPIQCQDLNILKLVHTRVPSNSFNNIDRFKLYWYHR